MTALTVRPASRGSCLLGRKVSDLQRDVVVDGDAITGTLTYVTGYEGFGDSADEQSGFYLALRLHVGYQNSATTVVELLGGDARDVTSAANSYVVIRVTDPVTQRLQIRSVQDGVTVSRTYDLSGLTLENVDGGPALIVNGFTGTAKVTIIVDGTEYDVGNAVLDESELEEGQILFSRLDG